MQLSRNILSDLALAYDEAKVAAYEFSIIWTSGRLG